MSKVLWDASALVKRYYAEVGSSTVNTIFAALPAADMAVTFLGYVECAAILRRKCNSRVLNQTAFSGARYLLRQEVLNNRNFRLMSIDDDAMLDSVVWVDAYSINSSDAAILETYLRHSRESGTVCILITSDKRLLKAALAEGLKTINPETILVPDVVALLTAF